MKKGPKNSGTKTKRTGFWSPDLPASPESRSSRLSACAGSSFTRWGWWLLLGVLLVSGVLVFVLPSRLPPIPAIMSAGLDPAVAQLIETATAELCAVPHEATAWGKLGATLMHYEFRTEALQALAQAERLVPREPRWPYYQSFLLLEQHPLEALPKLRRTVELCGSTPDMPRLRLGHLLLEQGHLAEAEIQFQTLLRSQPLHPVASLALARIRQQQERLAECTNALIPCLNDPHTAKAAGALLAAVQQRLGQPKTAAATAQRSESLPPDRAWLDPFWQEALQYRTGCKSLVAQATLWLDEGRFEAALPVLMTVTNRYPEDDQAWYLMGVLFNRQQRGAEAERVLREHLRLSPQSVTGQSQLAAALLAQQRYLESVEVLKRALPLKPSWHELHFNLGFATAKLGLVDEAIRHFRDALQANPGEPDTYVVLADLLQQRGETAEARQLLTRLQELRPGDERAQFLQKRMEAQPNPSRGESP